MNAQPDPEPLVTNFGMSRQFPTCIGNVLIERGQTRPVPLRAAKEIEKWPLTKVVYPEPVATPEVKAERKKALAEELSGLSIQILRSMAHRRGISGFFTMKKSTLIEALNKE